ncbi:MAG: hypothetical protein K0T00_2509, partial [Gaiellaceae bacterium]|nr:hypothetical protein [Gaiellaceae bacterium]
MSATTAPGALRESERAAWEGWMRPWPVATVAIAAAATTAA